MAEFPPARGRIVALFLILALMGCTPAAPAVTPTTTDQPTADAVAGLFADLPAAASDSDRWERLIDPGDPGFVPEAERLRANLTQFRIELTPTGQTRELAAERAALLDPTARAHAALLRWTVPGTTAPADYVVWLTLTTTGGIRVAGLGDGPPERAPRPLWWRTPAVTHTAPGVTVIAGADVDPGPWLDGLTRTASTLGEHGLPTPLLVAQLPATASAFEHVLGVPPGSHRRIAATAWPFGDAVHVVVNPAAVPGPGPARQVLLTHEAVHAVTGSVGSPVPLWLAEGYADLVALADHPTVADLHRRELAEDQRRHGIATSFPTAAELAPQHPRVHANYQRAWLAVSVLDRRGAAGRVHAATVAGVPLDRALAAEGWTEDTLAAAVHDELLGLAGP